VRDASKSAYEAAVKKSVDEKSPMPFKRIEGVIGFTNIDQIKSDRQGNTVPHFKKIQAIPGSFDATDLGEFTTQEIPNSDALRKGLIEKIPDRTLMLYQAQLKLASIADVKKVFN
jgi:hypothetical protein